MVDHIIFSFELVAFISLLVFGLGYCLGNLFNISNKKFKNEIKYIEGKYHRLRQEKNQEQAQIEESGGGFDVASLLSNPTIGGILKQVVENNPDLIKNVLSALTDKKPGGQSGFDLDKLR